MPNVRVALSGVGHPSTQTGVVLVAHSGNDVPRTDHERLVRRVQADMWQRRVPAPTQFSQS